MGRDTKSSPGLAGALFSRVQLRVLGLLFGQPERQFYGSELIRLAQSGSGAVQRELAKLTAAGLVEVATSGNRKLYRANRQSPIFEELRGIVLKTTGLVAPLQAALRRFRDRIDFAFVYGSTANGHDTGASDIDLMIVGDDITYSDVFRALQKAEKTLHRPINPNVMTRRDFARKRAEGSAFIRRIVERPRLFVFGGEDDIEGTR